VTKKYDLLLMVDDAHGEGVLGKGGRGIVDHFGLHGKVDVEVGTLSKAFGVVGGLVAGNAVIIEWLRQRGRPFLFSSAVTVPDAAACLAAIDLLEDSTQLVDKLWSNAKYFKAEMKTLGFNTGVSETPITPSHESRWRSGSAATCSKKACSPCHQYPTMPERRASA
jgi:glycine C-acetyltransferase